jgi:aminopeptidase-like protein
MSNMDNVINSEDIGNRMYQWATDLFPITRSLTGLGVRETLFYLKELLPKLTTHSVPSGTTVFDWTVPDEWVIRDAYIADEKGTKIIDLKKNNLHVIGYSEPVNRLMQLEELKPYLYSLPDYPDAIPYITSYYKKRWGFCLSDNQLRQLKKGEYRVMIDSELFPGVLNYGELIIPGKLEKEILLSTYICHPSMANNELSGPVVTAALAQWIETLQDRKFTYRIIFIPETIGAVAYIHKNLEALKKNTIAGFQVTCIGDDRTYSFLPSRLGNTISDKVSLHTLSHLAPQFKRYSFLDRGSDERQFCSPGVDLPVASIMRSKYGEYPEYHTSLDNLELISPSGLTGGFNVLQKAIELIEHNCIPIAVTPCEPQLGKRGLYPNLSRKGSVTTAVNDMMNLIAYSDGNLNLLEIAELISVPMWELFPVFQTLKSHGILKEVAEN